MAAEIDGTSKGLLGAFAAITLISGIVSLVYGIFLLIQNVGVEYNYGAISLFTISIILIVVGGLLIITVLLGVLGALKDISTVRLVSLVLLFILFVVLVILGAWAMVSFKTGRLEKSIGLDINRLKDKLTELTPILKKETAFLNEHYNCCIVYNTNTGSGERTDARCVDSGTRSSF
ncbi:unnamed protein product [Rotaria sp. Silwood2]|nr:unnamed protein product [Rotaria sp. Silwood2]CAF4651740.1 unnamed protein product [Rotaria sp. Silwood2]